MLLTTILIILFSIGSNKNLVGRNSEQSNAVVGNSSGANIANSAISTSPIQNATNLNTSGLLGSVDSPDEYIGKHFDANLGKGLTKWDEREGSHL
jgi:hypothetical protein